MIRHWPPSPLQYEICAIDAAGPDDHLDRDGRLVAQAHRADLVQRSSAR
jgi:hypothetical protein